MAHCSRDTSHDGSGDIAEVYPAASLRVWSLPSRGYKGPQHLREREAALEAMMQLMPWLHLDDEGRRLLITSDDAFDGFVCALTARAVSIGAARLPQRAAEEDRARRGWIHIPTVRVMDLLR